MPATSMVWGASHLRGCPFHLAQWKTTWQLVAVGFLIAGEAGDKLAMFIFKTEMPVVTNIGLVLLWLSALVTLYTGWDYLRAGLRHIIEEDS